MRCVAALTLVAAPVTAVRKAGSVIMSSDILDMPQDYQHQPEKPEKTLHSIHSPTVTGPMIHCAPLADAPAKGAPAVETCIGAHELIASYTRDPEECATLCFQKQDCKYASRSYNTGRCEGFQRCIFGRPHVTEMEAIPLFATCQMPSVTDITTTATAVPPEQQLRFLLPPDNDTLLLSCGDVEVHGGVMPGIVNGTRHQWFDRFRVVVGKEEIVRVELAPRVQEATENHTIPLHLSPLLAKDPTVVEGRTLTNLAVTVDRSVGVERSTALSIPVHSIGASVRVEVSQNQTTRIGAGYLETVQLSTGETSLTFSTAMTVRSFRDIVTHLDVKFQSLDTGSCVGGVLAEIWGAVPMSKATAAMLSRDHSPQIM